MEWIGMELSGIEWSGVQWNGNGVGYRMDYGMDWNHMLSLSSLQGSV